MKKWVKWLVFGVCSSIMLYLIQTQLISQNSWGTWNLPLSGKVIVIDPGHGGADGGAVGRGNVQEKEISLSIALKLRDYLQEAGALVYMTREVDKDLAKDRTSRLRHRKTEDLKQRVKVINESGADLFISIHLNAIPSPRWRGAQVFYDPSIEENKRLSMFIQAEIKRNLENTKRFAKPISNIYLVRKAKVPGSLVEVGFLSNPEERDLLRSSEYQNKLAASIYNGILRFYTNEPAPKE